MSSIVPVPDIAAQNHDPPIGNSAAYRPLCGTAYSRQPNDEPVCWAVASCVASAGPTPAAPRRWPGTRAQRKPLNRHRKPPLSPPDKATSIAKRPPGISPYSVLGNGGQVRRSNRLRARGYHLFTSVCDFTAGARLVADHHTNITQNSGERMRSKVTRC